MNEFSGQFGVQLMEIRKKRGITQTQLGELMGMSRQGISHWEKGRSLPDADMLRKLTEILEYDFITGDDLRELANNPTQTNVIPAAENRAEEIQAEAAKPEQTTLEQQKVLPHVSAQLVPEHKFIPEKLRPWIQNLLCIAVALAAGIMIGANTMPKTIVVEIPQQGISQHVSAELPPWEDEAKLAWYPMEDPARPVFGENGRSSWFYTMVLELTNNSMFTVSEIKEEMVALDGRVVDIIRHTPDMIGWGSGQLLIGTPLLLGGGFPVQDLSRLDITVYGTDACGETHEIKGQVNLSKEMAQ